MIHQYRLSARNNTTATQLCYRQLDASRQEVQRRTRQIKDSITEKRKERWQGKKIHGKQPRNLAEKLVDIEQSYLMEQKSGHIKGETGGTTVGDRDQAISTNYLKNKTLKK
jgi:hypothetical protein